MLINFAFTGCKAVCSPVTKHLAEVRRKLGDCVGQDIIMLTLTVDPANDTPERLARFAQGFDTGPGWYFLTGLPENMARVLKKLGGYTQEPSEHSSALFDRRCGHRHLDEDARAVAHGQHRVRGRAHQ